ncbi:MAG TPA: ATP-binding protein [Acidimicrobiales bacterium]|nr:ATP-binding protein [Acidimicrobiales bacterium]
MRDLVESSEHPHDLPSAAAAPVLRVQEELGEFVAAVAHDLLEPLTTVTGYLDLLLRGFGDDLERAPRELVECAREGAEGMQALVQGLLELTVATPGNGVGSMVDLGPLVSSAALRLGAAVDAAGATLHIDPLPTVSGDSIQLSRLFQNLIANALKFRRPDAAPIVQVSARPVDGGWHFTVSDNGIGIPVEHRDRVFETLKRLHPRSKFPGSGLGLAICKRIVEAQGGTIWVGGSPTGGATFHFTIPEVGCGSER